MPSSSLQRLGKPLVSPGRADHDVVGQYHWLIAGLVPVVGILATGRQFVARHGLGPPLPHNDSVILEYVGWLLARGNTLYVDVWEIKPPLAFLPPSLVAHVVGGDPYALHLAGIALTALWIATATAAAARTVGRVTGAPLAGVAVGLVVLSLPDLLYLPWLGYKAKPLVFALGLPAVDYALRGRSRTSGLLAGLAVGVWQLGIVFPVVTTATVLSIRGREGVRRHAVGGGIAAGCVVGVLLLVGDVHGFLGAVVLGPIALRTEGAGSAFAAFAGFFASPAGVGLAVVAAGGLALAGLAGSDGDEPPAWPLGLGGLLVCGLLLVDFDGLWDALAPLLFVAIGIGLLVGRLSRSGRVAALLLLAAVVVPTFAPSEFVRQDRVEMEPSDGLPPALDAEREHVYWTGQPIRSCRFFGAGTQRSLLASVHGADRLADAPCGRLDPYLRAVDARLPDAVPVPGAAVDRTGRDARARDAGRSRVVRSPDRRRVVARPSVTAAPTDDFCTSASNPVACTAPETGSSTRRGSPASTAPPTAWSWAPRRARTRSTSS